MILKKLCTLLLLLCSLTYSSWSQCESCDDIPSLLIFAQDEFLRGSENPSLDDICEYEALIAAQDANGAWTSDFSQFCINNSNGSGDDYDVDEIIYDDIDMGDMTFNDYPMDHLKNLADLSEAYAQDDVTLSISKTALKDIIILGLQYWYCHVDPYDSKNWWDNEIGKQRELQKISILLSDANDWLDIDFTCPPSTDIRNILTEILIDLPDNTLNPPSNTEEHRGANKADIAASIITKGILAGDDIKLCIGLSEMECAMNVGTAAHGYEGVQSDNSFHQHDRLLYAGGYGQSLIHNVSLWGAAVNRTCYDFADASKQVYFGFIVDGYRWMVRGKTTDYSANGRYISRRFPNSNRSIPSRDLQRTRDMTLQDMVDIPEVMYEEIAEDLIHMWSNDDMGQLQNVRGNKYFWDSDYVCQYDENFLSSIKMCSNRTIGTESVNHENKLGYWLPFGANLLYRRGDEYTNVFPYWDWSKIPGVTCPTYIPLFDNDDGSTNTNSQLESFVGNVTNEKNGVTAMNVHKVYEHKVSGLRFIDAKKAWFNFGSEIIALGTNISSNDNRIFTTLNQTRYVGGTFITGPLEGNNPAWVHYDETAYIANENPNHLFFDIENHTGNWNDINECSNNCFASGPLFSIYMSHGDMPSNDTYYYRVVPGIAAGEVPGYLLQNQVSIIKNGLIGNSYVQAVQKGPLIGVVFYPADMGNFNFPSVGTKGGYRFSSTAPCAILFNHKTGELCVSSPNRIHPSITVSVQLPNTSFPLPVNFTWGANDILGTSKCTSLPFITTGDPGKPRNNEEIELNNNNSFAYPSPFNNSFTIRLNTNKEEDYELTIYNNIGVEIMKKQVHALNGTNDYTFENFDYPTGIYRYTIKSKSAQLSGQMVKL